VESLIRKIEEIKRFEEQNIAKAVLKYFSLLHTKGT
jgi:hypothetical protein